MRLLVTAYIGIAFIASVFFVVGVKSVNAESSCCLYSNELISSDCFVSEKGGLFGIKCEWVKPNPEDNISTFFIPDSETKELKDDLNNRQAQDSLTIFTYPKNLLFGYVENTGKKCINLGAFSGGKVDNKDVGFICSNPEALKKINEVKKSVPLVSEYFKKLGENACCVPPPSIIDKKVFINEECYAPGTKDLSKSFADISGKKGALYDLFFNFKNTFNITPDGSPYLSDVFTCGAGGQLISSPCSSSALLPEDWSAKLVGGGLDPKGYPLKVYCAIKEQVKGWCICNKNQSSCLDTKYINKPDCLAAANGLTGKDCLPLDGGKKSCGDLAVKIDQGTYQPNIEDFNIPDISSLNQLKPGTTVQQLIGRMVQIGIGLLGTIVFALFIFGGVLFMMSSASGNSEGVGKAKDIIFWTAAGLFVILASYSITDLLFKSVESEPAPLSGECVCVVGEEESLMSNITNQTECIELTKKVKGVSSCKWNNQGDTATNASGTQEVAGACYCDGQKMKQDEINKKDWCTPGVVGAYYKELNKKVDYKKCSWSEDGTPPPGCYCDNLFVTEATLQDECQVGGLIKIDEKNGPTTYKECSWK